MKKWIILMLILVAIAVLTLAFVFLRLKKTKVEAATTTGLENLSQQEIQNLKLPQESVLGAETDR